MVRRRAKGEGEVKREGGREGGGGGVHVMAAMSHWKVLITSLPAPKTRRFKVFQGKALDEQACKEHFRLEEGNPGIRYWCTVLALA